MSIRTVSYVKRRVKKKIREFDAIKKGLGIIMTYDFYCRIIAESFCAGDIETANYYKQFFLHAKELYDNELKQ